MNFLLKIFTKKNSAILCLLFINFLFSLKYLARITDSAGGIALGLSLIYYILLSDKLSLDISQRVYRYLQVLLLLVFVIGVSFIFMKLTVESLNVDRWSVISSFWEAVFAGEYPYYAESHMGSKLGPMPFYYVLALPFYLIGELGYFSLLGLFILVYFNSKMNVTPKYKLFVVLFIMTSPFFLWEIVVRSNIFTTSMLIVWLLFSFVSNKNNSNRYFYLNAIIAGLLLSTRAIFSIPYIIFFLFTLIKKENSLSKISTYILIAFISFVITFLPLWIGFPNDFFKMNPFIVQSTFLVPFSYSIGFIVLAFLFSFFAKTHKDLFFWSGNCLFVVIMIYMMYNLNSEGLQEFWVGKKADISYFIFCIPFYIIYLIISSNVKKEVY